VFAATGYHLYQRRWFLPAWLFATAYLIGKDRFQFVAGAMMLAAFLVEGSRTLVRARPDLFPNPDRQHAMAIVLAVTVLFAGIGGLYAAGALNFNHEHSTTQPAFMDTDDRNAMQWVVTNTDADADFVVLGDSAEWFPLFTDRPILVGPWGVEWTSAETYETQLSLYRSLSTCESESCLSNAMAANDVSPDYVYVPKGTYTVRGKEYVADGDLQYALLVSEEYEKVYENQGTAVFRVTDASTDAGDSERSPGAD
jgi:hypothetical protein